MALSVESTSFGNGERIPAEYAVGVPAEHGHAAPGGGDRNPHLRWSAGPEGTRSYVVMCIDTDAPTQFEDANQEGRRLPADMPRQDFPHWVVIDIPADVTEIPEAADSAGFTPKGKTPGPTSYGGVAGVNGYTDFMAGNPDTAGDYGGYDGPFPPWNDERVHHYRFRVYALDVPSLGLSGSFTVQDATDAMAGHVLDEGEHVGTYTLNPDVR